jgi:DNA-binding response OmpR family regulator
LIDRDPTGFDLLLLDKVMPQLDGIALLKRIRADQRFTRLPVVMMTADSQQENIAEGLAAGAFYYLTKPSTPQVLTLVIKNTLDEFRLKRELQDRIGQGCHHLHLLCKAEFVCRTLSDSRDVALFLAAASLAPDRTVSGYSELMINAIEHGNLILSMQLRLILLANSPTI